MSKDYEPLPRAVTALVHHVELNREGWWGKTLNRLVLAAVWITGDNVDETEIIQALQNSWKLKVGQQKLESALKSLVAEDSLIQVSDKVYRIPEEARAKFEREIDDAEEAEINARKYFCHLIERSCPNLNALDAWKAFEQICLTPMVRDIGANTYRLIVGEQVIPNDSYINLFLKEFEPKYQRALRAIVPQFLDPKRKDARDYAMRLLHAYFCVEASGISGEVLEKLESITGKRTRFRLFVDTNFLFSFLGLHENPSNTSAADLKELLANLKDNLQVDLFVTPKTINEAKRVIIAVQESVSEVPVTDNFSKTALHVGISGMARRFFSDIQHRKTLLTARDWFKPYLDDFVTVAGKAGVKLFNEKLDKYGTRQDVIDDINLIMDHESKSRPEGKRKSYENVAHDVILWHFVKDKRPAYVESPWDAQEWILTVDFRLISFDRSKLKGSESTVPLCLHPTSLIQLLQFWVPRTQEFEEAVLGGLRLPFLFQEFDAKAERLSLEIIKQLGRFEGREAIPQETLVNVVMNDNLRSRISVGQPEEKEIELVRDVLVEEMRLQSEEKELKEKELINLVKDKDITLVKLLEKEEEKAKKIEYLEEKLEQISQSKQQDFATFWYFGILVVLIVLSVVISWQIIPAFMWLQDTVVTILVLSICIFLFSHWILEACVRKSNQMKGLWLFKIVRKWRKWMWAVVIVGIVGLLIRLIADFLVDQM